MRWKMWTFTAIGNIIDVSIKLASLGSCRLYCANLSERSYSKYKGVCKSKGVCKTKGSIQTHCLRSINSCYSSKLHRSIDHSIAFDSSFAVDSELEFPSVSIDQFNTMGSLLNSKTASVVVGFLLLLLPAVVYCQVQPRFVLIAVYEDKNCTSQLPNFAAYGDLNEQPTTFPANVFNTSDTFESGILTNYTGNVHSLVACQAGLECNATGAVQISFNLSDVGVCATAGPEGTLFDKFLLS